MIKVIGKGAFGVVYLGQQKLTNRLVAIKVLKKDKIGDEMNRRKI